MSGHDITNENLEPLVPKTDRRFFLKMSLSAIGLGISGYTGLKTFLRPAPVSGTLSGASFKRGHSLLNGGFSLLGSSHQSKVIIVGGGMAGLHAGWWLKKNGYKDFLILELEDEVGGKSRYKSDNKTQSPLGAHYLPIPNAEATHTIEILKEMGVITGETEKGFIFDEDYICFDPKERLFIHGRWQDGIVPNTGLSKQDEKELGRFFSKMETFKYMKGSDKKSAFTIPMELSSQDPKLLALDQMTMEEWMRSENFKSEYLDWYVNYCCLDDFGTPLKEVSAWAGIHYFASRRGKAENFPEDAVLTWPEGNGRIVKYLKEKLKDHIKTGKLVKKISTNQKNVKILVDDFETKTEETWSAEKVIYSAPRFIAKHVIGKEHVPADLDYSPWMVSNITIKKPANNPKFYWDNVNYRGRSLGYIHANHMNLKSFESEHVLTLYWPLVDSDPVSERRKALIKTHGDWTKLALEEIETMHPGIRPDIKSVDVWLWGHAMVRPTKGFIWGESRAMMKKSIDSKIIFAHSDMSGMSLCEEAGYWGVEAAKEILNKA
ncbi:MAG: NAD(P)-binding protein [Bacteriovoracaceae bacterium]|nr:NAD(P)-binding protein [Bacteriovoracaceae bacterium]